MTPSDDIIRCNICGISAPICDMNKLSITAYHNSDNVVKAWKLPVNICEKCLPNLLVMLELALIKTSRLMVAENGGVLK